jgi:hypothetical protein
MSSHKDGVLAAIDQALSLVSCETVRALLRTLINMLVEQATSTAVPTVTCCDCSKVIPLKDCRTSYAAFNFNGMACSDCFAKLRAQVADGKINDAAVDAITADRDRLKAELEECRDMLKREEMGRHILFLKAYPHGKDEIRRSIGRLCFCWYHRHESTGLEWRMSEAYMDDQVDRVIGKKPLDGNASDAACAVAGIFNKVREEMQL